ncbi:MAG TPA: tetratricopeptide repeat protein, partial [Anaerolineales bacterium]|nr:tetratricopeptide repeat protein [Anaerolineales bacterium]
METADSAVRLLSPKLHLPPTRKKWVNRKQLLEKLNTAANHKLTLLCAPAGYGKTTLLSQWINQFNTPVGWLSLDNGDSELTQFTRYVVAAIQQIDPNICRLLPQMLQPPQPLSMTEAWIYLINELSASQKEFFIILDDYQEIQNQLVHDQLGYLLEHMPVNLHLVIATRADPPFTLPRLRVQDQLLEIRADELRFNAEDAKGFIHEVIGLPLSDEDAIALVQKTEGWVAGLQIAGIVLQKQSNLPQAVQNFTGSHRHVLDYLVTEVIERLPAATQNFIQQTVILDSLEASLCDAVTGGDDSQKILEQLEQANQFIIPLDNNRHWYRYHRLLKEALQRRTADMDSKQCAGNHLKASIWFEQHNSSEAAIRHAFMADDLNRAARLIDRDAERLIKHSQIATLLQWLNRLTPEQFHNFPRLNITRAWATLFKGESIHSVRDQLESSTSQAENALEEAEKEVIHGMVAIMTGEVQQALAYSSHALSNLPTEKGFLRSIAHWNLAMAYVVLGDFSAAIQAFRENIALALEMNNTMFAVASLCNLGGLYLIQGHLKLSDSVYLQALELATTASGNRLPVACRALMGLSEIAREWNQLKQAQNLLEEAIQLSQQYNQTSELIILLSLARVYFVQGNEDHALELAQKALAMAIQSSETQID